MIVNLSKLLYFVQEQFSNMVQEQSKLYKIFYADLEKPYFI